MNDFSLEQSGNVAVLAVNSSITVEKASELKDILLKAVNAAEHVVVNLERVTEVDVSCLQILCSAHRTLTRLKKRITLGGIRPEVFLKAVECAGFDRHTGCVLDTTRSCLWVQEKEKNLAPV